MPFPPIAHLSWAQAHNDKPRPDCNLSLSAMETFPLETLPWDPDLLGGNEFAPLAHERLVALLAQRYQVSPDQVLVTVGSTHANFLATLAHAAAGDEVAIEEPVYEPLWRNVAAIGARLVFVPRGADWSLDPDAFKRALSNRTRLVILTNLHNPTGRLATPETIREIGRMAAAVGAVVLCDEVYLDGLSAGEGLPCARAIANGVSTASLTKVYGLGPLRCGWAVGPRESIALMRHVMQYTSIRHAVAAEALLVAALMDLPRLLDRARTRYAENGPIVSEWVAARPALRWTPPDGGFVGFVRLPAGIDDVAFAERLERERATWVTPGSFFRAPGHIRIGFGIPRAELVEGLRRIAAVLKM